MRVSREESEKSHARILQGASRLMRERGIDGTSVAEVMNDAGLTQGGFYRHFKTKEALVADALSWTFDQMGALVKSRFDTLDPQQALAHHRADYLSDRHVIDGVVRCPLASLGNEIARGSAHLKATFGAGITRLAAVLATAMKGSAKARQAKAMREIAMLVGAVMIARASDPETAQAMLEACRSGPST